MKRQSARATEGSMSIAACLTRPFTNGSSHAPRMSRSPGCTHSIVIIVLAAHEPQLADQFRYEDDRHTGNEPVERTKGRKTFEREMQISAEDTLQDDFSNCHDSQAGIKPALEPGE